jgi:hypothetical protein
MQGSLEPFPFVVLTFGRLKLAGSLSLIRHCFSKVTQSVTSVLTVTLFQGACCSRQHLFTEMHTRACASHSRWSDEDNLTALVFWTRQVRS